MLMLMLMVQELLRLRVGALTSFANCVLEDTNGDDKGVEPIEDQLCRSVNSGGSQGLMDAIDGKGACRSTLLDYHGFAVHYISGNMDTLLVKLSDP